MPAALDATDSQSRLAPAWHTAVLAALIVVVAVTGTVVDHATRSSGSIAPPAAAAGLDRYAPVLLVQWGLVFYVCRVGRARSALSSLLGRRWDGARRACGDLAVALALMLAIVAVESVWGGAYGAPRNGSASTLLPATHAERAAWVLVSLSTGFCEEVVYRGYMQRQLAAFTRSADLGLVSQAALFGIAHADQGLASAARVALYGALIGAAARYRRSLIPGIVAHTSVDLLAGLA